MGTINIEFAAIVFVVACVASCALVCLAFERRYAARLAAANERERGLASALEKERMERVEAQTRAIEARTERDALRGQVLARLDAKQAGDDLPNALHKWCTKAARIVLKNFPLSANEREMVAASATVGALLNVNDAIGKAVSAYIETAGLDAPIYGPGTAEFAKNDVDDDDVDDDDDLPNISDRDSDPPLQ